MVRDSYAPVPGRTPEETLHAFISRATADPGVVGLVLSGSRVHAGMPTVHSDYDLHVVVRDEGVRNKYLRWELERQPLGDPRWDADRLLPALWRILADGDPPTRRALFAGVEEAARRAGHDEVLDAWGTDLGLLRPR
ncbi:hypothetical protein [Streptomyces sp. SID5643]|uniref:hypothetical protein n=1 Tax=Streptomyces sp. SID5643 TaxID=2690307 RepID=UPI00136D1FAF|nr:hypothetical protein [Streptomyces sp. SID5643]MZF84859.1 hypothetical protein [Streptomyces sp. SID5643]